MKRLLLILFSFLIFLDIAQCHDKISLGNFDISPNDKQVIFSYIKDGISGIYIINIDGSNLRRILSSNNGDYLISPKFTKDGNRFLYLLFKNNSNNTSINICDINGQNNEILTDDNSIITEAIFSRDGKMIYFCKANEYKAYSPIGVAAPHDMDIYSLRLIDKKVSKCSNIKSYGISSLSDFDSNYFMMRNESGPDGGMVFLSKANGTELRRFVPANNPRKLPDIYYIPTYSDTFKTLVFIAPYEIFKMDMQDKIATSVFFNKGRSHINNLCIFRFERKILYTTGDDYNLHMIDYDGRNMNVIPINIK